MIRKTPPPAIDAARKGRIDSGTDGTANSRMFPGINELISFRRKSQQMTIGAGPRRIVSTHAAHDPSIIEGRGLSFRYDGQGFQRSRKTESLIQTAADVDRSQFLWPGDGVTGSQGVSQSDGDEHLSFHRADSSCFLFIKGHARARHQSDRFGTSEFRETLLQKGERTYGGRQFAGMDFEPRDGRCEAPAPAYDGPTQSLIGNRKSPDQMRTRA